MTGAVASSFTVFIFEYPTSQKSLPIMALIQGNAELTFVCVTSREHEPIHYRLNILHHKNLSLLCKD